MLHLQTVEPSTLELLKDLQAKPYLSKYFLVGGTAMKLSAISSRGKKKDFYDVYFFLQHFTLRQMLTLFEEKFERSSVFHLLKSLVYFEDAEPDAEPIVFEKITWQKIKKTIQEKVRNL